MEIVFVNFFERDFYRSFLQMKTVSNFSNILFTKLTLRRTDGSVFADVNKYSKFALWLRLFNIRWMMIVEPSQSIAFLIKIGFRLWKILHGVLCNAVIPVYSAMFSAPFRLDGIFVRIFSWISTQTTAIDVQTVLYALFRSLKMAVEREKKCN